MITSGLTLSFICMEVNEDHPKRTDREALYSEQGGSLGPAGGPVENVLVQHWKSTL